MTTLIEAVHSAGKNLDSPKTSRMYAVAAALEVIRAHAESGSTSVHLGHEFEQLSTYADHIQEALKAK
jgi:hypothetical protein